MRVGLRGLVLGGAGRTPFLTQCRLSVGAPHIYCCCFRMAWRRGEAEVGAEKVFMILKLLKNLSQLGKWQREWQVGLSHLECSVGCREREGGVLPRIP